MISARPRYKKINQAFTILRGFCLRIFIFNMIFFCVSFLSEQFEFWKWMTESFRSLSLNFIFIGSKVACRNFFLPEFIRNEVAFIKQFTNATEDVSLNQFQFQIDSEQITNNLVFRMSHWFTILRCSAWMHSKWSQLIEDFDKWKKCWPTFFGKSIEFLFYIRMLRF